MSKRAWAVAGVLTVAASVPFFSPALADDTGGGSSSSSASSAFGGFAASVSATPVQIELFEPQIPLPASPQGEADLSFTSATMSVGPTSTGTASTFWPGAALGNGFGTLTSALGLPSENYPVKAQASFPGGPATAQQTVGPAAMNVSAGDTGVTAVADSTSGLPFGATALVGPATMSSTSTLSLTSQALTANAVSSIGDLAIGGGLIQIQNVHADGTATSDGTTSTAGGHTSITGLNVLGKGFTVDDQGAHQIGAKGSAIPLPGDALKQLGITFAGPTATKAQDGSFSATALTITIDTAPLRTALSSVLPYRDLYYKFVNSLPAQLQQVFNNPSLPSVVDLAPIVVYKIATVSVSATAAPALDLSSFGTGDLGGSGGDTGSLGTGASSSLPGLGAGSIPSGSVGGAVPSPLVAPGPAAKAVALPKPFGGVPAAFLAGGLVGSALIAFGLRWLVESAGLLPGAIGRGCAMGAGTGVPDLRNALRKDAT